MFKRLLHKQTLPLLKNYVPGSDCLEVLEVFRDVPGKVSLDTYSIVVCYCNDNTLFHTASGVLYCDRCFDGGPGVVAFEGEVFGLEGEYIFNFRIKVHSRQGARGAAELLFNLIHVVEVKVRISGCMDELSGLEAADLREHHRQKGVRCDIERHPEEHVRRALVELAAEFAVRHVELEEAVAWREAHLVYLGDVPCADENAAGIRVVLNKIHDVCYTSSMKWS